MGMQEIDRSWVNESGALEELKSRIIAREGRLTNEIFSDARDRMMAEGPPDAKTSIREVRNISWDDTCPCGSQCEFGECCGKRLPRDDERICLHGEREPQ